MSSHLTILGGGYIALEFGQLLRCLGAKVTIIQRSRQLLPREDPEIAACILDILCEDGIDVRLSLAAASTTTSSTTPVRMTVERPDKASSVISGSRLFLAAGRTPNTDSLNLLTADIATVGDKPNGHITVNDHLETDISGIYALGDVKDGPAFTHISYGDYCILKANLLDRGLPPGSG